MLGRTVQQRGHSGISAHSVVVTVCADESAVEPDVARGIGRNGGKFRREEILFAHTVLFAEIIQNGEFDFIAHFAVRIRKPAYDDVELLALDDFARLRRHLIGAEVRQQIVDIEYGIAQLFPDRKFDLAAVLANDCAVQGKRDRRPLIFLDAAVIMRFQETHTRIFIQGILLDVDPRRVDMRRNHAETVLFGIFTADAEDHDRFAAVDEIFFIARFEHIAEPIFGEALGFRRLDGHGAGLAFGLCRVEKGFVPFRIRKNFLAFLFACHFEIIGFLIGQFFL